MKNKGFTLVELLAVIVILGVLLTITIPIVKDAIEYSKEKAYDNTVDEIIKGAKRYVLDHENNIVGLTTTGSSNLELTTLFDAGIFSKDIKNPKTGEPFNNDATIRITTSSNGTYHYEFFEGTSSITANPPVLASGMTPIKWDGSAWVNTTEADPDWYSYAKTDRKWANAKTDDGSYWVWIPRYIYKITSGWHTSTTGVIEVRYSIGTDDTRGNTVTIDSGTTSNASNNKWTNHPAFTFGTTELTGIWVAKFEATAVEGIANGFSQDGSCPITGDDVTTKTVKIIPNAQSWRCISLGNNFTVSRNMETNNVYGWGTSGSGIDTHLMKNVEWGAIAYISKSAYGKDLNQVWVNTANNYTTGCAGNSETSYADEGCLNAYQTTNGVKASTTGNIYGIYDMAGGAHEMTAAYANNGHSYLSTYGSSLLSANAKYKDVYAIGTTDSSNNNYNLAINHKGDAIYETSDAIQYSYTWFQDYAYMANFLSPSFVRGGGFHSTNQAGLFGFEGDSLNDLSYHGFRPILVVGPGL